MSYPALKGLLEAGKEALRYLVISFVAEAGTLVVQTLQAGVNPVTGAITINWAVVEAVAVFSLLTVIGRAVDKFKFVYSKEIIAADDTKVAAANQPSGVIPF
jgi:hypothetical protein